MRSFLQSPVNLKGLYKESLWATFSSGWKLALVVIPSVTAPFSQDPLPPPWNMGGTWVFMKERKDRWTPWERPCSDIWKPVSQACDPHSRDHCQEGVTSWSPRNRCWRGGAEPCYLGRAERTLVACSKRRKEGKWKTSWGMCFVKPHSSQS